MNIRTIFFFFAITLISAMSIYFYTHPSYKQSLEARYYYETGEYKDAYSLAKDAFELDSYNRMASTVMAQSKIALKYVEYIDMGKKYMQDIDKIANHENISDGDKAKIKMICKIMLDSYIKLTSSVITDEDLVKEAESYYLKFEKLFEKVRDK